MSLIRQVWLLLAGVLVFALGLSIGTCGWVAQQAALAQVQARNDDGAMLLALALSQQAGDVPRMQRVASMLFDTGRYSRLRVVAADGTVWFERDMPEQPGHAPRWFAQGLSLDARPGTAHVNTGSWQPLGGVELSSHTAWATDALWAGGVALAGWTALVATALSVLSWYLVRSWQRPLRALQAQARALDERRFILAAEPKVPELRQLTRSMNTMVQRLQAVFVTQAEQLEELRERAHTDVVTGLANRRLFIGQLNAALRMGSKRGAGLLIVRVRDLQAMNRRIGHDGTDRLLAALGEVLQTYPRRVLGARTGRLNGSDFALFLPAAGMARDSARSLVDALQAALATVDQGAELVIGGADDLGACTGGDALARADMALARAEERGAFAIELAHGGLTALPAAVGEAKWHERLSQALASGQHRLSEFPMVDAAGRLLQLECSLRLRWPDTQAFQPASSWLAMALRCRLAPQVDQTALTLALAAISRDGLPRCVNVAAASLASPGFVSTVAQLLAAAPQQATHLSIDLREAAALRHGTRLRQASASWRGLGAKLGLEHAGTHLRELPLLHALGIDYIKIDASFVQDVARDAQVREFARGLASLLRGMNIQVLAEGVESVDDLATLWQLGFDGATGPALRADASKRATPAVAGHDLISDALA
jgi:predicted signal transduction protein with EAL and GGDEF domain